MYEVETNVARRLALVAFAALITGFGVVSNLRATSSADVTDPRLEVQKLNGVNRVIVVIGQSEAMIDFGSPDLSRRSTSDRSSRN